MKKKSEVYQESNSWQENWINTVPNLKIKRSTEQLQAQILQEKKTSYSRTHESSLRPLPTHLSRVTGVLRSLQAYWGQDKHTMKGDKKMRYICYTMIFLRKYFYCTMNLIMKYIFVCHAIMDKELKSNYHYLFLSFRLNLNRNG